MYHPTLVRSAMVLSVCGWCAPLLLAAGQPGPDRLPNVLFVYIDDLGFRDTGFQGANHYRTPRIDGLAAEGMVFENAYSNGPNCAPSRASLMSGQYTPRHGVFTVGNPARGAAELRRLIPAANRTELDANVVTLGELFRDAGYRTGYVGKWHLGKPGVAGPCEQGFAFNAGGNQTGSPAGGYFPPYRNPQLPDPPEDPASGEYLTERLTREAGNFLQQADPRPFFLFLAHYAVHTPIQARASMTRSFEPAAAEHGFDARYAAMLESVDQSVGTILDQLETLGLSNRTIVIFTSDNGGHGKITDNRPLRGSKGMLYEGGIRVPMCVRWPEQIAPGTRSAEPVSGVDFFETFRMMLHANLPAGQPLDGVDLMPLWRGHTQSLERDAMYWHFPAYLQGRDYPGAPDNRFRTRPCAAIRCGDWKLLEYFEEGAVELYHLGQDPGESINRATDHPGIAADLAGRLKTWQEQIDAPVPRQPNPQFREPADRRP